jgi:hypothetical protein
MTHFFLREIQRIGIGEDVFKDYWGGYCIDVARPAPPLRLPIANFDNSTEIRHDWTFWVPAPCEILKTSA